MSAIDAALYFDTGSGNQRRVLDVDRCYRELGSSLCDALIGFHTFTGIFRNYNKSVIKQQNILRVSLTFKP